MSLTAGRASLLREWDLVNSKSVQLSDGQNKSLQKLESLCDGKRVVSPVPSLPTMVSGSQCGGASSAKNCSQDGKSLSSRGQDPDKLHRNLSSAKNFMEWVHKLENGLDYLEDSPTRDYYASLEKSLADIHHLMEKVNRGLDAVNKLSVQNQLVSNKSNSLHIACQSLLSKQEELTAYTDSISERLVYYTDAEGLVEKLGLPSFSIQSEAFAESLNKIDKCVEFLSKNPDYVNSNGYIVKYRAALSRALGMIKDYVRNALAHAANSTANEALLTSDDTFALLYGRFRAQAPKIEVAIALVETRATEEKQSPLLAEYQSALQDCQSMYFDCRSQVLLPSVKATLSKLVTDNVHNHCGLVRSGCSILLHISEDEYRLCKQFFKKDTDAFGRFMEGISVQFYDTVRPLIVGLQHLETLSELTTILRIEMLDYHCGNHPIQLQPFEQSVSQLLHDIQERLIFRSHIYIRSDIADYRPHPGDLSYPEKLEMMESIQESIKDQGQEGRRYSTSSNASQASMEVASINKSPTSSPVDLHGMWYPTVRRTLVCLSRLYRCLELEIFQGLSQEVLSACTYSLEAACAQITSRKGNLNGQLFLIKHLLILREQMTPFQVQLSVLEHSLDFSKLKTAALSLISQKGTNVLHGDKTFVKYLLDGATPDVKETSVDSRREIDKKLKMACETFIGAAVDQMIGPIKGLTQKINDHKSSPNTSSLSSTPWGKPENLRDVASDCQRRIKKEFPVIQKLLHLYLCNKETEFILFRPIRNEVMATFVNLLQEITNLYTPDERLIIAFPSQEQVAMLLSSLQIQTQMVNPATPTNKQISQQNEKVVEKGPKQRVIEPLINPSNDENTVKEITNGQ